MHPAKVARGSGANCCRVHCKVKHMSILRRQPGCYGMMRPDDRPGHDREQGQHHARAHSSSWPSKLPMGMMASLQKKSARVHFRVLGQTTARLAGCFGVSHTGHWWSGGCPGCAGGRGMPVVMRRTPTFHIQRFAMCVRAVNVKHGPPPMRPDGSTDYGSWKQV